MLARLQGPLAKARGGGGLSLSSSRDQHTVRMQALIFYINHTHTHTHTEKNNTKGRVCCFTLVEGGFPSGCSIGALGPLEVSTCTRIRETACVGEL